MTWVDRPSVSTKRVANVELSVVRWATRWGWHVAPAPVSFDRFDTPRLLLKGTAPNRKLAKAAVEAAWEALHQGGQGGGGPADHHSGEPS